MSPEQLHKKLEAIEALPLLLDQLRSIRDQPPLPPDHPDAGAQAVVKTMARAALGDIQAQISEAIPLALKQAREIIAMPSLPAHHPHAAALREAKRNAQILLLLRNAHYGPGGPLEGLGPVKDDAGC